MEDGDELERDVLEDEIVDFLVKDEEIVEGLLVELDDECVVFEVERLDDFLDDGYVKELIEEEVVTGFLVLVEKLDENELGMVLMDSE